MSNIKVSVIIPCYNVAKTIKETLECALAQTLNPIEIIAVDDGSTDNTWELLQNYPTVKSFRKENGGYGSAVNFGMAKAQGEYIAILEDDIIIEDYYYILYQEAKRENLDAVSYNSYLEYRDHIKPTFANLFYPHDNLINEDELVVKLGIATMGICFSIYKRAFLFNNNIKLNEEVKAYEDVPFIADVFTKDIRYKVIIGCGYLYRRDVEGQSVANPLRFICLIDCIDYILYTLYPTISNEKLKAGLLGYCLMHLIASYNRSRQYDKKELAIIFYDKIKSIFLMNTFIISSIVAKNFASTYKMPSKYLHVDENKYYHISTSQSVTKMLLLGSSLSQIKTLLYYKLAYYIGSEDENYLMNIKQDVLSYLYLHKNKKDFMLLLFAKSLVQKLKFPDFYKDIEFFGRIIIYLYEFSRINLMLILTTSKDFQNILYQYPDICYQLNNNMQYKFYLNQSFRNSVYIQEQLNLSEAKFLEYIENKSIAIVGNSPCEKGKGNGSKIDSHDIIIRFNNYELSNEHKKDYGIKTNIWAISSAPETICIRNELYQYDYIISSLSSYEKKLERNCFINNYFLAGGKFFRIDIASIQYETNIMLPSLGLVCIKYLMQYKNKIKKLSLYGFSMIDHYEGKRHYFENDPNSMEGKHFHKWTDEAFFLEEIKKELGE